MNRREFILSSPLFAQPLAASRHRSPARHARTASLDCKGHAGYMGSPSKTGTPSPGIVKDSLAIWRRGTARHGVGRFIHFSGIWDSLSVKQHL